MQIDDNELKVMRYENEFVCVCVIDAESNLFDLKGCMSSGK